MLELQAVTYRYPGYAKEVLRDVDVRIENGEIVGLVGPNEAGKSTLCLVASGLAPASIGGTLRGEVRIDGEPAAGRRTHELATLVGLVFQNPNTQRSGTTATVFEEVAMGPVNLGMEVAESLARTREALAALRIEDLAMRNPQRLSGGQAQLVAIASILAMRPRHLVLDEPTAQLDPEGTRLVGEAFARLAARGTALLIAEHKTDLLDGLCDRVVVMDAGRVVRAGPAAEVLAMPELAGLGVEPPSRVRLERAVAEAGAAGAGSAAVAGGHAIDVLATLVAEDTGRSGLRPGVRTGGGPAR
jgi:energy-coupling factor transport system ATP-binding protein